MRRIARFSTLSLLVCTAMGQTVRPPRKIAAATIRSTSTLVIVPTLVKSTAGKFVTDLRASDFTLTDNGVKQKVSVEEVKNQGIAVVVLMQTGGAAPDEFQNYRTFTSVLDVTASTSNRKVALVTFDSQVRQIWNFPPKTDGLEYAFAHPNRGDNGAAIMDAVNRGIDLLQEQPVSLRRIILLLSQPQDAGSTLLPSDVVRRLGESNTVIYSVTFSPKRTKERKINTESCSANTAQDGVLFNDIPSTLLKRICQETASQIAMLSGGETILIQNKAFLKQSVAILADDFSNSYTLSFQPSSHSSGFHQIRVSAGRQSSHLRVSSRTGYWVRQKASEK
ncbi:MAG TPA: VWA domain-containing protein [Edaphobacter sp.]|nr:VWA domain-containing protein [Edaphobacter sp.]